MAKPAIRLGTYVVTISTLWVVWVLQYLPTQSVSAASLCAKLTAEAQLSGGSFTPKCESLIPDSPDRQVVLLLIITCAALFLVSLMLLLRERNLIRRLLQ
jgi:hypothetical protein